MGGTNIKMLVKKLNKPTIKNVFLLFLSVDFNSENLCSEDKENLN
jgi:hypothetical protein